MEEDERVYSTIKKILWRYERTFTPVFLVTLGTSLGAINIYGLDVEGWKMVLSSALVASISAGITAVGKALRSSSEDYSDPIHKLPF